MERVIRTKSERGCAARRHHPIRICALRIVSSGTSFLHLFTDASTVLTPLSTSSSFILSSHRGPLSTVRIHNWVLAGVGTGLVPVAGLGSWSPLASMAWAGAKAVRGSNGGEEGSG
jgi:hypothetical protein